MDSYVIDWLNNFKMSMGTLLALVVVLVGFVIWCIHRFREYKKNFNETINEKAKQLIAADESKTKLEDMEKNINNITESIGEITKQLQSITDKLDKNDEELKNTRKKMEKIDETISTMKDDVDILIDSDKESIRSFILSQYYKITKEGKVDLYTLNTLDYKYSKYKLEDGNSFVSDLMKVIHSVKKVVNLNHEDGQDPIGYFDKHPEIVERMMKYEQQYGDENIEIEQ